MDGENQEIVQVPTRLLHLVQSLGSNVKDRLCKLQNQRHVLGDNRIDEKTLSAVNELNNVLSQLTGDDNVNPMDKKVRDLEAHLVLQKDQCASLRDSLQLSNFRELRLISKIDTQRQAWKQLEEENSTLRKRIAGLEAEKENGQRSSDKVDIKVGVDLKVISG